MIIWLKGIGIIALYFSYILLFNWISIKYFKCDLGENNPIGYLAMPFLIPLVIPVVIFFPYVIGKSLF